MGRRYTYKSGEEPMIGDVVRLHSSSPRANSPNGSSPRRLAGSTGTVEYLGATLDDPMPYMVLVKWDLNKEYRDDDTMLFELELVKQ